MSFVANRFTVFLDANVLTAERKRDVLLSFFEAGLFRGRWSNEILGEVKDNLEKSGFHKGKVARLLSTMRDAFPDAMVANHIGLADGIGLPDEGDRHVLSAAIRCSAQIIVTENKKDFPSAVLEKFDLEVLTADEFLVETFDLFQMDALRVMREVRLRLKDPSFEQSEFIMELTAKGLPQLAAELRERRYFL